MNESGTDMVRAIYRFLKLHQEALTELVHATGALRAALESDPVLLAAYEKHYAVLANGPDRRESEKLVAQLEEIIRRLTIQ